MGNKFFMVITWDPGNQLFGKEKGQPSLITY